MDWFTEHYHSTRRPALDRREVASRPSTTRTGPGCRRRWRSSARVRPSFASEGEAYAAKLEADRRPRDAASVRRPRSHALLRRSARLIRRSAPARGALDSRREAPEQRTALLVSGQLSVAADEHRVEHRLGELAGEGVLLARVERAEHRPAGRRAIRNVDLDAVAEPRPGPHAEHAAPRPRRRTRRGTTTTRTSRSSASSRSQEGLGSGRARRSSACWPAARSARPRRCTPRCSASPSSRLRRSSAGWRGRRGAWRRNSQSPERSPVNMRPVRLRAVGRRREADDEDRGRRVAEARHGPAPVVLVGYAARFSAATCSRQATSRGQARHAVISAVTRRERIHRADGRLTLRRHGTPNHARHPRPRSSCSSATARRPRPAGAPRPGARASTSPTAGRNRPRPSPTRIAELPKVDAIYASPLERARETAAPIAKAHRSEDRGRARACSECDFGEWTGQELKTLIKLPEWQTVQRYPSGFRFPSGEVVRRRCRPASWAPSTSCVARHTGGVVVAVSHADPIKAAVAQALGTHLDLFQRIVISTVLGHRHRLRDRWPGGAHRQLGERHARPT